jgi:hypothetical protein
MTSGDEAMRERISEYFEVTIQIVERLACAGLLASRRQRARVRMSSGGQRETLLYEPPQTPALMQSI